jgi:hypothetical protein
MGKKIEDMSEEELSRKSGKAYDKAMPEADTTFGKMEKKPPVTKARKVAEEMESERTYPISSKMAKETPTMAQSGKDALKAGIGLPLAMGVDMITGPKRRSDEEMSELTREVAKGNKYAKGGSASSRADGCAERGKTRGMMVMCGGGMTRK